MTAATTLAATACGRDNRKGRLLPGFDADLLAVRGNPVEQLTDLFNVHAVIRAGLLLLAEQTSPLNVDH